MLVVSAQLQVQTEFLWLLGALSLPSVVGVTGQRSALLWLRSQVFSRGRLPFVTRKAAPCEPRTLGVKARHMYPGKHIHTEPSSLSQSLNL